MSLHTYGSIAFGHHALKLQLPHQLHIQISKNAGLKAISLEDSGQRLMVLLYKGPRLNHNGEYGPSKKVNDVGLKRHFDHLTRTLLVNVNKSLLV